MGYRTRPRFEARIERRKQPREATRHKIPQKKVLVARDASFEPGLVLEALHEMHNGRRVGE